MSNALPGSVVVELGCGTGVGGITAGILGARKVILTDLPYTLPNAMDNVQLNKGAIKGSVEARPLDWSVLRL